MATITRTYVANFGPANTGRTGSVGYTLTGASRVTAGVTESPAGSGIYSASVTHDDQFSGLIVWDISGTAKYAVEEINPGDGPTGPTGPAAQAVPASVSLASVYCTDEQILCRASQDYVNLCPKSQVLAQGTDGVFTSGDRWTLTSTAIDLGGYGVTEGHVVQLTRPTAAFPAQGGLLMGVASTTSNAATLRRPGHAAGVGQPPAPAAGASGVEFRVLTYAPQIDVASYEANKFFGIDAAIPNKAPSRLYDPREIQQFTVLTVLRRAYIAAEKAAAGDFALKLADVTAELEDLKSRLVVHWGNLAQGQPGNSVFAARTRR